MAKEYKGKERVVAVNQRPDFRTEHEKRLGPLFVPVLRMCREAGPVKLGVVALDGSKVAANTSLAANRSHSVLEEEVGKILTEVKKVDAEEDELFGAERRG